MAGTNAIFVIHHWREGGRVGDAEVGVVVGVAVGKSDIGQMLDFRAIIYWSKWSVYSSFTLEVH